MARRLRRFVLLAGLAAASAGGWCAPARGGEFYYVLIFGSESAPKRLRSTHTWATFVKAEGDGPDLRTYTLTTRTISWLPRSLDVRVWTPRAEPGINLSLEDTLRFVLSQGEDVRLWGPFIVRPELWQRAANVIQILESGQARYRAISGPLDMLTSDCIHAVAAVDPVFGRGHYPLIRVGMPASRYIARELVTRSVYDQHQRDNAWLIPRLGLDRYPILVVPPAAVFRESCVLCRHPE